MIQFNPDGSLKVPKNLDNKKREEDRLNSQRCIRIRKDLVSNKPPKTCILEITVSKQIVDRSFIQNKFNYFNMQTNTPCKFKKDETDPNKFIIEIGSDFKRCSDCEKLCSRYRGFLNGNIITDKGTCPKKEREFAYEDYFD